MLIVFALFPLLIALLLLLALPWRMSDVGWITLGVTIVVVSLVPAFHQTPWQIALSLGEGTATMLAACTVLLPLLLFCQMQQASGAIEVLARGVARFVPGRDLQTMLFVFGVGPCIESLCGFGSGAIVLLPFLVRLHDDTDKAIQLGVLSQIVAAVVDPGLGTTRAALFLFPSIIGCSLLTLQISGGRKALERYWYVAIVTGSVFLLVMCVCRPFFLAPLAGVLASGGVIALLFSWGQQEHEVARSLPCDTRSVPKAASLVFALLPAFLLVTSIATTRLIPAVRIWVQTHGLLTSPVLKVHLALLSGPGVWLLFAALLHPLLFPPCRINLARSQVQIGKQFLLIVAATGSFSATAALIWESGMLPLLENTVAMLGKNALWVAPLMGALEGWFSRTTPGSHTLMLPMLSAISAHSGVLFPWLIAVQNVSAAMGAALFPARILLLAISAGLVGKDALVVRKIGPLLLWSLALITLLLGWLTSAGWVESVIILLALLLLVHVPLILCMTAQGENGKKASALLFSLVQTKNVPHSVDAATYTAPRWMVKVLAFGSLFLVNILYASFALVSVGPLKRIDPVLFVCFQMLLLAPVGLLLLYRARKPLRRECVVRGLWLGGLLSAELLCYTVSLKETGMTEAMVFSAMNGVIATLMSWKVFGQRISTLTRWAYLFALMGACLVWFASPANWQGDVTAFVSGICLVGYAFQIEQLLAETQQHKQSVWSVMGVQFVTTALVTVIIALCFGQWETVHRLLPSDLAALVYVSFAAVLLPCILMLVVQRTLSAITVAFFSVVEPFVGASFAFFSLDERLPMLAYLGGSMVIVGMLLQVLGDYKATRKRGYPHMGNNPAALP